MCVLLLLVHYDKKLSSNIRLGGGSADKTLRRLSPLLQNIFTIQT